jgi:hypothetical protein
MRVPFSHLFHTDPDGSITPRTSIQICGVTVGPGMSFPPRAPLNGVDLTALITALIGHDLEIQQLGGAIIVVGFY